MNPSGSTEPGPTRKQLVYLRKLAERTGQTFTVPRTRRQASAQIRRLQAVVETGFTFAEVEADPYDDRAAREAAEDAIEIRGLEVVGSGAAWRERS